MDARRGSLRKGTLGMAGVTLLAALAGTPVALGQALGAPEDPPSDQPPIQPPAGQPAPPPAAPPAGETPGTPPAAEPKSDQKSEPKAPPAPEAAKPQPATTPEADPTKSRAIDDVAKEQDSNKKDPGPIAPRRNNPPVGGRPTPVRPAIPAPKIGVDDIGVPTGGRYGEGKFLLRRTGTLVKAPTGEWVFAFAKSTASKKERPAILLPCAKLTQLEAQIGAAGQPDPKDKATPYPDSLVTITGEVFNYLGREYILLSLFSVAPNTPEAVETRPEPAPAKAAAAPGTSEPSAMDVADPSVEELIKDLQQRRGSSEVRALAPTAPPPARKPVVEPAPTPPPQAGLVAEGTVLAAKRGRIVRLRGGELAFSIDNDAASASQPLVLLPCRTLERLEQLFWSRGDATVIELSGRTTIYKGRNYVLPTSFMLPVPSELRPMQ